MNNKDSEFDTNMYDVLFYWNAARNNIEYKQYCAETLCNILGYNPTLSVKLVYEAAESGRSLLLSTRNIEKATLVRDTLLALEMQCQICPVDMVNIQ